jgi:hypothetical protein
LTDFSVRDWSGRNFVQTGEFRYPQKGEYFISRGGHVSQAASDFSYDQWQIVVPHIAVTVRTKQTFEVTLPQADGLGTETFALTEQEAYALFRALEEKLA